MIEMYGFWLADIVCLDCLWAATATGKKWNDADIFKKKGPLHDFSEKYLC